jgi:hypothetical protein
MNDPPSFLILFWPPTFVDVHVATLARLAFYDCMSDISLGAN